MWAEWIVQAFLIITPLTSANEGGAPAAAAPEAAASAPKTDEWVEVSNRVMGLKAKIKLKQDNIKKMITEKQLEKDAQKVAVIIQNLNTEHKALKKDIEDYNQESAILKYRFPEKALAGSKRQYERLEISTLDEMETQLTLDHRIKKVVSKAQQQYSSVGAGTATVKKPVPANEKEQGSVGESSNITTPIIIEK